MLIYLSEILLNGYKDTAPVMVAVSCVVAMVLSSQICYFANEGGIRKARTMDATSRTITYWAFLLAIAISVLRQVLPPNNEMFFSSPIPYVFLLGLVLVIVATFFAKEWQSQLEFLLVLIGALVCLMYGMFFYISVRLLPSAVLLLSAFAIVCNEVKEKLQNSRSWNGTATKITTTALLWVALLPEMPTEFKFAAIGFLILFVQWALSPAGRSATAEIT